MEKENYIILNSEQVENSQKIIEEIFWKNGNEKLYNKDKYLMFEYEFLDGCEIKGKEYANNRLIFEGEYLYGKRNGKGIEYYKDGKIKFGGEFLFGKRNGKGKEYVNNNLIFEGEYLDGKRNGKGKEFNENNDLILGGEYLNGERWNGKEIIIQKKE